ncbi:MAG TPA: CHAP domain-containing protein [Acidimicrobiales bacterium]|nr:CHAP domain-containing protein [Acidimicrobiales bacterium]
MASVGVGFSAPAAGQTGGYPYSGASDCSGQFGTYSWCIDRNGSGSFTSDEQWSGWGFAFRNCTDYVAWKINSLGVSFSNTMGGRRFGNATNWDDNARSLGWTVSTTPRPRSIAVREGGYGHVAFVESVNADGSVNVSQYNSAGTGGFSTGTSRFDSYIYIPGLTDTSSGTNASSYANTLVRWEGDGVTTWFVTPDLRRLWIPDGGTFNELKARGFAGPHNLTGSTLDRLPDMRGYSIASGWLWGANRTLRRGMNVRSSDGRYTFALQTDGNLVLYGPTGRALWATSWRTSSSHLQEYVVFQADGNLVTYGSGRAIWWSNTGGSRADRFAVQSDGNLVVYRQYTPVWASNTSGLT